MKARVAESLFAYVSRRVDPLVAIKVLHTAVWALLAGCILALPITGLLHRFHWAIILTVIIVVECAVLTLNKGRCPLTNLAARFTENRPDNFDIYLSPTHRRTRRFDRRALGTFHFDPKPS